MGRPAKTTEFIGQANITTNHSVASVNSPYCGLSLIWSELAEVNQSGGIYGGIHIYHQIGIYLGRILITNIPPPLATTPLRIDC